MKPIFINQWSLKLCILTALVPFLALLSNNFHLPQEGTASSFFLYIGGAAAAGYLGFGVTLAIRELCYQTRIAAHKRTPAPNFQAFYNAYTTINEQIKWEARNQNRNQPSKIITLRRIQEIDPPPLPVSGPYPELDDEQKKMGVALHQCSMKQEEMGRELTEEEARVIYSDVYAELSAQPRYHLPGFMYTWLARVIFGFVAFCISLLLFAYIWTNVFHMGRK